MSVKTEIRKAMKKRILKKLDSIKDLLVEISGKGFFVAGGAFDKSHTDIDLYPLPNESFSTPSDDILKKTNSKLLADTRNAITISHNNETVQLCNYKKGNLKGLVESFDFAHIKIGAKVATKSTGWFNIEQVYASDDFLTARAIGSTFFTGSEYPLSSLVRILKYWKRGWFAGNSHIAAIISTVAATVTRGFHGYEDFKDQMDAVDLMLVPNDIDDIRMGDVRKLYESLNKEEGSEYGGTTEETDDSDSDPDNNERDKEAVETGGRKGQTTTVTGNVPEELGTVKKVSEPPKSIRKRE